jgi:hypothetical protein
MAVTQLVLPPSRTTKFRYGGRRRRSEAASLLRRAAAGEEQAVRGREGALAGTPIAFDAAVSEFLAYPPSLNLRR